MVRLAEALRFKGWIKSVTISCQAGEWFASISVEIEDKPIIHKNQGIVGVDLGITTLATLSTGEKIGSIKPYNNLLKRVKRSNRALSRKKPGSQNRKKARRN